MPRNAFGVLHVNLVTNLRQSSIEPHRISQLIDSLNYDLERFVPDARPIYSGAQIIGFDDFLYNVRDNLECLPYDEVVQGVYADNVVMMLSVSYLFPEHCCQIDLLLQSSSV